ncbi:hypothetical protein [Bradyrhizobium sp. USDA 4454]
MTAISLAASVTLPVSIIARKASTCRGLIRATLSALHNISAYGACHYSLDGESEGCDLFHQVWMSHVFSADPSD